ncbi:DUF6528 family protein [Actinacidiphila guanduensis]|uniref:Uncharacterized protein n=1 Tax=Actinacidiphila guanduensis TaxID=310781 RepID=A0A1H0IPD2_9ACTN|nr:DUF6528 family protein [Actinacidiphila guanduensis]SDO33344.1 hypothetical protein SAMN05216259_10962 [Actinacidiphila guanduensis]
MTGVAGFARPSRRALLLGAAGAGVGAVLPLHRTAAAATVPAVVVGDQRSRRALVLDGTQTSWDPAADPSVVLWSFAPDGDARYADLAPAESFTYVSEVKARSLDGVPHLLVTASYGFAAVVEYGTGARRWGGLVATSGPGADLNPHSAELLPNGNVAVACSAGDAVRIYSAAQGPASTGFTAADLATAHGVHWDDGQGVLWAVGGSTLVAYDIGTADNPALTVRTTVPLPTPDGHDVNAVSGSPDLLWVATGTALYRFSKSARTFAPYTAPTCGAGPWGGVKAVSNAGDTVLFTEPDGDLTPNWQTRYARIASGTAAPYTLAGGGIYKARWWQP